MDPSLLIQENNPMCAMADLYEPPFIDLALMSYGGLFEGLG